MSDVNAARTFLTTEILSDIESKISYVFKNKEILTQAFIHKSYYYEEVVDTASSAGQVVDSQSMGHNEKLEFLGDAVLDLALSHIMFDKFPNDTEGALSKKRASLVNEAVLNQVAIDMNLEKYLLLGFGEEKTGGRLKPRLIASTFEAVLGAMYLDGGLEPCMQLCRSVFEKLIEDTVNVVDSFMKDYKTRLQEYCHNHFKSTPTYELVLEDGPSHKRRFVVTVKVEGRYFEQGEGGSKKWAEQQAAEKTLKTLSESEATVK